jgi:hypothetical protein
MKQSSGHEPSVLADDGNQIATDTLTLAANDHLSFTHRVGKYPVTAGNRGTIAFATPSGGQIGARGIRIAPTADVHYSTCPGKVSGIYSMDSTVLMWSIERIAPVSRRIRTVLYRNSGGTVINVTRGSSPPGRSTLTA